MCLITAHLAMIHTVGHDLASFPVSSIVTYFWYEEGSHLVILSKCLITAHLAMIHTVGHFNLVSPCPQATPRFYLAAMEKNREKVIPIFLHGCEIKSGSGLGTRLG